jgi:hypothetical protein
MAAVVPTNEELQIAMDTVAIVSGGEHPAAPPSPATRRAM